MTAHKYNYENALREITDGRKRTHWIWFIFPQLAVLGHSANAKYYGISGYDEAKAYYEHPILGTRLREITMALLQHHGESAVDILGGIDAVKVRFCMTLFDAVSPDDIFQEVLDAFLWRFIRQKDIGLYVKDVGLLPPLYYHKRI